MTALAEWQNLYVIVESSAGALIGLQFVVLSLITGTQAARTDAEADHTFATPTIVHFGAVLGLSGSLSAPWDGITTAAVLWGLVGFSSIVYAVIVTRRMRVQSAYQPELEDWLFHVLLPIAAYVTLAVSAYAAHSHLREALFGGGAAAILLLFTGIHNAWDAVTYMCLSRPGTKSGIAEHVIDVETLPLVSEAELCPNYDHPDLERHHLGAGIHKLIGVVRQPAEVQPAPGELRFVARPLAHPDRDIARRQLRHNFYADMIGDGIGHRCGFGSRPRYNRCPSTNRHPNDSEIQVPRGPGLGIDLNEEAPLRYRSSMPECYGETRTGRTLVPPRVSSNFRSQTRAAS